MIDERDLCFATAGEVRGWLSGFILRELDPRRVLSVTAGVIGRFLRVSRVCFGEINIPAERAFFLPDWTDGVPSIEGPQPFYPESEFGRLYALGRTIAIDDNSALRLIRNESELLERSGDRCLIAVPLLRDGEVVAVFSASDHWPRRWTEEEVALMSDVGPMIWRAYEHLLTLERLAEAERRLSAPAAPSVAEEKAAAIDDFTVSTPRGDLRLPVGQIEWIEALRDYVVLHAASGNYAVRQTMAVLERGLDARVMLRVHRSAFVAIDAMRGVERRGRQIALTLRSGAVVPVSAAYADAVRARLGAVICGRRAQPRCERVRAGEPATVMRGERVPRGWMDDDRRDPRDPRGHSLRSVRSRQDHRGHS